MRPGQCMYAVYFCLNRETTNILNGAAMTDSASGILSTGICSRPSTVRAIARSQSIAEVECGEATSAGFEECKWLLYY